MEVPVSCLPPVKVILPLCLSSTRQLRATFTKASSFCLWYLGIVAHTRNTRHTLIVLAWYIVMARGRQCNNNWKVRSFFVFKETQEVHSCIVSLCVFFFSMKNVPPWAWFCRPRTDLLTCDWRLGDWPRCGQPVTSIVTSRSPAPRKHLQQVH